MHWPRTVGFVIAWATASCTASDTLSHGSIADAQAALTSDAQVADGPGLELAASPVDTAQVTAEVWHPACDLPCVCAPDGTPCDDGEPCTVGDTCAKGSCSGGTPRVCQAFEACLTAKCVPGVGCSVGPAPEGTPCSDGSLCTLQDACHGGQCTGTPLSCDDGNPCTADTCTPGGGCAWVGYAAPCDDGNACTHFDVCQQGQCTGVPFDVTSQCDDANPCTTDACSPQPGCTHANHTAPCDDGNACTTGDACNGGVCKSGTFTCQCGSNADCFGYEDGNLCNGTLFCDKGALPWTCKVNPQTVLTCPPVGKNPCLVNTCKPTNGLCALLAKDGECDAGGGPCNLPGYCDGGKCLPDGPIDCDDKNPCTMDDCDAAKGGCTHVALAEGKPCGASLVCQGGKCVSTCTLGEFSLGGPGKDSFADVIAQDDGGWVAVGSTEGLGTGEDGWIVRFDLNGKVVWNVAAGGQGAQAFNAVALATDGTLLVVGVSGYGEVTQGLAMGFSPTGAVTWSANYGENGKFRFNAVDPQANGGFLAVGAIDVGGPALGQGWLVRCDGAGVVLWQKQYGYQSNDMINSIAAVGTHVLIGGLSYTDGKDGDGDAWLGRVDPNGALVWSSQVGGAKYQTTQHLVANGAYLYAFGATNAGGPDYDGLVIAAKTTGGVEWQNVYGGAKDDRFNGAAPVGNGMIAVGASNSTASPAEDGWLVRIDGSGKLMWAKTMGGPFADRFNAAATVYGGGIVAVGSTAGGKLDGKPTPGDGWVVRLDSAAVAGCP